MTLQPSVYIFDGCKLAAPAFSLGIREENIFHDFSNIISIAGASEPGLDLNSEALDLNLSSQNVRRLIIS